MNKYTMKVYVMFNLMIHIIYDKYLYIYLIKFKNV